MNKMENFKLISEPVEIFDSILEDISEARRTILLETFSFSNDEIGRKFLKALVLKVREGVKVKVLVDAWGSDSNKKFFKELIELGGEVKFFREFNLKVLFRNHNRNHRKLLVIDEKINYFGSANITAEGLDWLELVIRFEGNVSYTLIHAFDESWEGSSSFSPKELKNLAYKGFKIIRDIPSKICRSTQDRYIKMIRKAKSSIEITSPYFLPPSNIRRELFEAHKRGVKVRVIIPEESDWKLWNWLNIPDLLRSFYIGKFDQLGIEIYLSKKMLHSKMLVVDSKSFLFGSSNLDYRSLIHQYEMNLVGHDAEIVDELGNYFEDVLKQSKKFNHKVWYKRGIVHKILEGLLWPIRKLF